MRLNDIAGSGDPVGKIGVGLAAVAAINRQASREYPLECCGILVGTTVSRGGTTFTSVGSVTVAENVESKDRARKFAIAPELLLQVHRTAGSEGLAVVGYYHSHPDGLAVPSETDRLAAWPGVSYLILEIGAEQETVFRSWRLSEDGERFHEERVELSREFDL
jgi:proteasome lid subunit RPN8/RPN11